MLTSLATLPEDSLQSILSHTSPATSIRCALTSKSLLTAANAVARGRVSCIGTDFSDEADTLPWEECETRPLAVVFKKELSDLLIQLNAKSSDWRNAAEFLWFKLTEKDLYHEFEDDKAGMMVHYDMEVVEWLHCSIECAREAYDQDCDMDLYEIGLEVNKTLWQRKYNDHLVFTANLALHDLWGRNVVSIENVMKALDEGESPFCVLTQRDFGQALFDRDEHVLDPHGGVGSHVAWHYGVGDKFGCWFRCSLAFFDAIEKRSIA